MALTRSRPEVLGTHAKVLANLNSAFPQSEKPSLCELVINPPLLQAALVKQRLASFEDELSRAEPWLRLSYLEGMVKDKRTAAHLVRQPEDLRFLLEQPELPLIFKALHVSLEKEPDLVWLVMQKLGFNQYLSLMATHPFAQLIFALLSKQTPKDTLSIIQDGPYTPKPSHLMVEDVIMEEPLKAAEAYYLNVDLPLGISEELKLYNKSTLASLSTSPFSREAITPLNHCPYSLWQTSSPSARFVMLVQSKLPPQENIAGADILAAVRICFLQTYLQNHPATFLLERLNKNFPLEQIEVPAKVCLMRQQLLASYFPQKNTELAAFAHLEEEVKTYLASALNKKYSLPLTLADYFCCKGPSR